MQGESGHMFSYFTAGQRGHVSEKLRRDARRGRSQQFIFGHTLAMQSDDAYLHLWVPAESPVVSSSLEDDGHRTH